MVKSSSPYRLKLVPDFKERKALYKAAKDFSLHGRIYKLVKKSSDFVDVMMNTIKEQDKRKAA